MSCRCDRFKKTCKTRDCGLFALWESDSSLHTQAVSTADVALMPTIYQDLSALKLKK